MADIRVETGEMIVLRDSDGYVFVNYPIHFAGMGVFLRNDSPNPTTVRVHESADGVTWNLVLVSTHSASGLASVTLVGLSLAAILFVSDQKYARISLAAANGEGVFARCVQFTPTPREPLVSY